MYYEALVRGIGPRRDENGHLVLANPLGDKVVTMVAVEDIGRTAYGIFLAGSRYVGRTVDLAGAHVTAAELATLLTDVLGEEVVYRFVSADEMRASGAPGIDEIAANLQFYAEASESLVAARNLDTIRQLNPRLKALPEWLAEHRKELSVA
jgi:hypothetical protein